MHPFSKPAKNLQKQNHLAAQILPISHRHPFLADVMSETERERGIIVAGLVRLKRTLGFQIVVKSMVILVRERASFGRLLMTGIRARLP
jgi:polysaccharide pyruvyl transferase WcaK-like protein